MRAAGPQRVGTGRDAGWSRGWPRGVRSVEVTQDMRSRGRAPLRPDRRQAPLDVFLGGLLVAVRGSDGDSSSSLRNSKAAGRARPVAADGDVVHVHLVAEALEERGVRVGEPLLPAAKIIVRDHRACGKSTSEWRNTRVSLHAGRSDTCRTGTRS